jgi:anaerobic selenocysteine-containing dehydrogenase
MPPEQALHSDLIVVWGNNVTVSNLHLVRVMKKAREKGARIVIIDPKRTKAAEQCDLFLQIHPGTDVVLAMAAAAELERRGSLDMAFIDSWTIGFDLYMAEARKYGVAEVERLCELRSSDFHSFVALYETAQRIAVSLGNGIERGHSGGSGLRAAMALQALTGNHARRGAGVIAKPGLAVPKTTDRLQRPDLIPDGTRTFNIVDVPNRLLDASLDPPVKAILIYNHNPVATHPNQAQMVQALSQEDLFIAGSDVVMTDSMLYADVILPAASHFEYADIYGSYGQNYLQRAEPVIPCVGQSQPNTVRFSLTRKMDLSRSCAIRFFQPRRAGK